MQQLLKKQLKLGSNDNLKRNDGNTKLQQKSRANAISILIKSIVSYNAGRIPSIIKWKGVITRLEHSLYIVSGVAVRLTDPIDL